MFEIFVEDTEENQGILKAAGIVQSQEKNQLRKGVGKNARGSTFLNRYYVDGEGRNNGGGGGSSGKEILMLSSLLVGELEDEDIDEFEVVVNE